MATEILITVTKNTSSRKFIFETGEIKSLGRPMVNQIVSLDFIEDDETESQSFTLSLGKIRNLQFTWKLYGITTDRADGSYTSTVKTYAEMLNYLEDVIMNPDAGQTEFLVAVTDKFRTNSFYCVLEDFNIDVDSGLYPTGNVKFKIVRKVS